MLKLSKNPTKQEISDWERRIEYLEQQIAAQKSLLGFTRYTFPKFLEAPFHKIVCDKLDKFLEDVIAQKSPRLAFVLPPRHTKSELVSRRFPSYAFGRYPHLKMVAASHSMPLAEKMNRDVQRIMMEPKYKKIFKSRLNENNVRTLINQSIRNAQEFEVIGYQQNYKTAGAGGAISGFGFDIANIDDPFGKIADANSPTIRQNRIDWLNNDIETRLETGGGILVTHTRFHDGDLIGYIKEHQSDYFDIVEIPAIAVKDEGWRKKGEALHPERYDIDTLKRRQRINPIGFEALYQGNPTIEGGAIFLDELMRKDLLRNFPKCDYRIITADTAQKDGKTHDFTCFQCWGFHVATHTAYLLDVYKKKLKYPELKEAAIMFHVKHASDDFHGRIRSWEIEDKSSGISLIQDLKRPQKYQDQGFVRIPANAYALPSGSKTSRAQDMVGFLSGCVFPKDQHWSHDYFAELLSFPTGVNDDMVDPTVIALDKFFNIASKNENKPKPFAPKKLIGA